MNAPKTLPVLLIALSFALEASGQTCDEQHPVVCREEGVRYMFGQGVAVDADRAATLFDIGCKAGDGPSCLNEGLLAYPMDAKFAVGLIQRGCELGHQPACFQWASELEKKTAGIPPDPEAAQRLYQQACDGGVWASCHELGLIYVEGRDHAISPLKAAALFRRACDNHHAASCTALAALDANDPNAGSRNTALLGLTLMVGGAIAYWIKRRGRRN